MDTLGTTAEEAAGLLERGEASGEELSQAYLRAIEERDGATFYVERTSPLRPIQLLRTPGFRRIQPPR